MRQYFGPTFAYRTETHKLDGQQKKDLLENIFLILTNEQGEHFMKKIFAIGFVIFLLAPLTSEAKKSTKKVTEQEVNNSKLISSIYFEDDSAVVTDKATIDNNAKWIKSHGDKVIVLSGYCDERGSPEYNLNLGDRRARNVMKALMDEGVVEKQLILMSYGKNKPKVVSHNRNGWSANRRVDFVIR